MRATSIEFVLLIICLVPIINKSLNEQAMSQVVLILQTHDIKFYKELLYILVFDF